MVDRASTLIPLVRRSAGLPEQWNHEFGSSLVDVISITFLHHHRRDKCQAFQLQMDTAHCIYRYDALSLRRVRKDSSSLKTSQA
ncbi:hypothetical protein NPIL_158841 [Nephila pilipes]|uniref:Uncharacterized protein n=1 Tax=Nephila pilipes TaxID=299642 RepID=A0A8X6TI98_NEPPI|nr:hypothetical protein NPIL_158841 [Nephila pilipes]